jgi:hypothetical protein
MNEQIFCAKSNKRTKLYEAKVSWSGDTISTCNLCQMTVWDIDFNEFHKETNQND